MWLKLKMTFPIINHIPKFWSVKIISLTINLQEDPLNSSPEVVTV